MNFDNWQDRIVQIKKNVHKMNCNIDDRETYYYELIEDDYEWLFGFIEKQSKLINSLGRIADGMIEDHERLELSFQESKEEFEVMQADRDYWKSKFLLIQRM